MHKWLNKITAKNKERKQGKICRSRRGKGKLQERKLQERKENSNHGIEGQV